MNPIDPVAIALTLIPATVFAAILVTVAAIVRSVASAEPGGLVPRTMDPKASWEATW